MYRILSVLVMTSFLIISFSSTGFSQNNPIKFGVRGGLNLAKISGDLMIYVEDIDYLFENTDKKMRTGFSAGGFVEFWVSPTFAIQANALFNMKGVKLEGTDNIDSSYVDAFWGPVTWKYTVGGEETAKISYLSFPIMGKFVFGQEGSFRPYIFGGPEIGFILSAKDDTKANYEYEFAIPSQGIYETGAEDTSYSNDIKDQLESFEFALNFGAGVIIPLGNIDMFIDGRYGLGLTKVNKEGDESYKNNVIYVNVGLLFGGK